MANPIILQPYVRRRSPGPIARFFAGALLILVATIYGVMAIMPMSMVMVPAVPIMIVAAMCLWLLPDIGVVSTERIGKAMLWFLGCFAIWPNYVAFDLPGLPWIYPARIALGIMLAFGLFNLAASTWWRQEMWKRMEALKPINRLFWAFWAATTVSLLFMKNPGFTLGRYANNQVYWTFLFAMAAWFGSRPGYVERACKVLVITLMVSVLVGLNEARVQEVFWLRYLPPFLQVDPEFLARVAKSQARAGTDVYRVRSTFAVSLYYAEYLAMMYPLLIHFILKTSGWRKLSLCLALAGTLIVGYETNARSAMVGALLTLAIYPFFVVWRARKRNPTSVTATAGVLSYPAAMVVVANLVIFWRRLHVMILGGGQHQASSDARKVQWEMGWPKVFSRPLGHGPSSSGEVLGYMNGAGELTIDTFYLSCLLDYGFLGLATFVAMFALPMWFGYRIYMRSENQEQDLAIPLAIGLFNFVVIKAVLSSEGNMPIAFCMLGFLCGLMWQQVHGNSPIPQPEARVRRPQIFR